MIEPDIVINSKNQKTYIENDPVISFPKYLFAGNSWEQRPEYYTMTIDTLEEVVLEHNGQKQFAFRVQAVPGITVPIDERYVYFYWIDTLGVLGGTIAKADYYFDFERTSFSRNNSTILNPRDF
jgi:hypothetical protein